MTKRIMAVLEGLTPNRAAAGLAAAGALAVAYGIGMIYTPAGVIAGGLLCVGAAYLIAYFGAGRAR